MSKFKISQIQFQAEPTPEENASQLNIFFNSVVNFKPDLICTPECSNIITNDKEHLFKYSTLQKDCPLILMSKKFAKKNKVNIHLGSLLLKLKNKKKLVNRSILINKFGRIEKIYDKINLFDVDISKIETHRESNYFYKGEKIVTSLVNGIKIGFTICYDLRFPELYRKLAKKDSKIILVPAAFTVPTGKAHWETLLRARAIENSVYIIATNMCGTHHTQRKTYGHSMLFSPWGNKLKHADKKPKILNTSINLSEIEEVRRKIPLTFND